MTSKAEIVGARSAHEEIAVESDEIVAALSEKKEESDANEILLNDELTDVQLQTGRSNQSSLVSTSPLFSRCTVVNPLIGDSISEPLKSFSVVSYNILAECHAGGEYDNAPWITTEQLKIEYRHQNLMLELEFLNADAVCLQEVGPHYYLMTLAPAMKRLGYNGQYLRRLGEKNDEGEATFYKTSSFELISYKPVFFSQIAEKDIETLAVDLSVKAGLRLAVASHAVMLLTRLSLKAVGKVITLGNIHVAFDEFKRPDLQCVQIALAMRELIAAAEGTEEPSIICGDFNCFPSMAPYQLMEDNRLNQEHLNYLMKVTCADGQRSSLAAAWPEGFCYPTIAMKSAYKTILGAEPMTCWGLPWIHPLDYIWYSSSQLQLKSILKLVDKEATEKGIPNDVFPSDHLSLKATFMLN